MLQDIHVVGDEALEELGAVAPSYVKETAPCETGSKGSHLPELEESRRQELETIRAKGAREKKERKSSGKLDKEEEERERDGEGGSTRKRRRGGLKMNHIAIYNI